MWWLSVTCQLWKLLIYYLSEISHLQFLWWPHANNDTCRRVNNRLSKRFDYNGNNMSQSMLNNAFLTM